MDSSSIVIFICLMLLKWQVRGQDDSLPISSVTIETQYLTFDMAHYGPDGGIFSSPNFPNYYPQDTILFYQFIASSDYRVQIEIDLFQIRGVPPQCTHDYLDVFINVTNFDIVQNVLNDQLLHRYCGRNKPPLLVSFTNLLLLGFFTEDTQTERGFNGSFRFISAQPYRNNLIREPCDYIFNSSISKRGEFFSSTYPGTYLPWQFCNYSFIGLPDERIHIRFRDLILFKTPNTQHCAIDLIKLYDKTLDPPELRRFLSGFRYINNLDYQYLPEETEQYHITDLCGTYTLPLDVYSTSNHLLLYFIATHYADLTDDEQTPMNDIGRSFWRKGFFAEYEFLSSLSKLDFITKNKSNQYLSGTECDQTIKSFGQGYGKLLSPNWPYPYKPQTSCTTYLLGLDDRYTLENVEIEFDQFDIDCHLASLVIYNASRIYDYHLRTRLSSVSSSSMSMTTERSSIFSNYYRQDLDFKANLSFCGHFKPEGRFVSKNALLKVSLIPNDRLANNVLPSLINGGKYQARYKFVKSYHQVAADEYDAVNPTICNLSYYELRAVSGSFEPPRSSENDYFSNSNCTFNFYPLNEDSRLLIWYDYFNIVDDNYIECPSDNLTYTYSLDSSSKFYLHPFIYCGYRNFPSPYLTIRSTQQFRIHFRSNDDSEAGLGFDGRYLFLNQSNTLFSSYCRSPFDPIIYINETQEPSGNLSSNGYPENVICEWSYITKPGYQFNLELNMLEMEGSKTKDPPQGCQSSVLRIYSEKRIDEFCGQEEKNYYFLTDSHWFTIQFISLNRQTKEPLRGFQLFWTVVQVKSNITDNQCLLSNEYFDCKKNSNSTITNSFCIHRSLVCDGQTHCQPLSNDDELSSNCFLMIPTRSRFSLPTLSPSSSSLSFLHQNLIIIITIFILCIIMLCVATILIFLLIKMKRREQNTEIPNEVKIEQQRQKRIRRQKPQQQQDNLSLRKKSIQTYLDDDDENNQRLIGINMMEQAVTTV
ncbi:unnamed protein product [Rotaria sp. Silwood2]|nr:unnamed protein product [Rotaria sp. Silwood2]CAF2831970.1 unnamed protein product [Rotaria sp. Silwood2]CAF3203628.1 unnamed protein product [Rotaria sp. Silwood2]CAF4055286.1 unnamed protein product [Rotaria sp. Silwood2]CAF4167698.1 unnamed protein product [Rotaria sp. Silwood2]